MTADVKGHYERTTPPASTRRRRRPSSSDGAGGAHVVVAATSSTVVSMLPVFLLGGIAPLVREDVPGFREGALGLSVAIYFLSSAGASVVGGRMSETRGPRRSMILAALVSGAASLVLAAAPHVAVLLVAIGAAGIANGIAQTASNLTLAWGVPPGRQGLAFGIKQAAVPAATLLAGLALPVVGLTLGWRATFALATPFAFLVVLLVPRRIRGHVERTGRGEGRGRLTLQLGLLAAASGCGAAAANSMSSFVVLSSVDAGLATGSAGFLLALGSGAAIITRTLIGRFADVRARDHLGTVAAMMATGVVGYVLIALGTYHQALLVAGVLLAFAAGWGWPGLLLFAVVRLHPSTPASSSGLSSAGAAFGGVIGPPSFGLVAQHSSYAAAWACASFVAATAAGLVVLARSL